ncbi:hypothetical protein V8E53_001664, partial [Lactarius tabidus]
RLFIGTTSLLGVLDIVAAARCSNETAIAAVSPKEMNSETSWENPWGLLCDDFGVRKDIEDIMRVVGDSVHGPMISVRHQNLRRKQVSCGAGASPPNVRNIGWRRSAVP